MSSTKKISKEDLTVEQVLKVIEYDPITGTLSWLRGICIKGIVPGSACGSLNSSGYRVVNLFGTQYKAHRLIWFIQTGAWPKGQIDHINQVRSDNRWANLREVSVADNAKNRGRNPNSKLGEHGIWYNKRTHKYVAEITVNGKKVYQKSFDDIDEAIEQRKIKSLELGFHENHGAKPTGM